MFNDSFWEIIACAGVGIGSYLVGKKLGQDKASQEFHKEQMLQQQQSQIAAMQKQINDLKTKKGE